MSLVGPRRACGACLTNSYGEILGEAFMKSAWGGRGGGIELHLFQLAVTWSDGPRYFPGVGCFLQLVSISPWKYRQILSEKNSEPDSERKDHSVLVSRY